MSDTKPKDVTEQVTQAVVTDVEREADKDAREFFLGGVFTMQSLSEYGPGKFEVYKHGYIRGWQSRDSKAAPELEAQKAETRHWMRQAEAKTEMLNRSVEERQKLGDKYDALLMDRDKILAKLNQEELDYLKLDEKIENAMRHLAYLRNAFDLYTKVGKEKMAICKMSAPLDMAIEALGEGEKTCEPKSNI